MYVDITSNDFFYKFILEASRIQVNGENIIPNIVYDSFDSNYPRYTRTFFVTQATNVFSLDGFNFPTTESAINTYLQNNPIKVYVNGVSAYYKTNTNQQIELYSAVSGTSDNPVTVTIEALGKPFINEENQSQLYLSSFEYPIVQLNNYYIYDKNVGETVVFNNRKLKRIANTIEYNNLIGVDQNESYIKDSLFNLLGYRNDVYTVINSTMFLPFEANGYSIYLQYQKQMYTDLIESVSEYKLAFISQGANVRYTDRFFPNLIMSRENFMLIIYRMINYFYQKFTDETLQPNTTSQRVIRDQNDIINQQEIVTVLNQRFLDGCFVFPLYSDDTFKPSQTVSRAEAVVYFNKLIEWSIERFR